MAQKEEKSTLDKIPAPLSDIVGGIKKENVEVLTENQAKEALRIVTGISKASPKSEKVRAFVLEQADRASRRMVELSEQDENKNVAFNATKDILDRAGVRHNETHNDSDSHFIGEDEAILILRRRFGNNPEHVA